MGWIGFDLDGTIAHYDGNHDMHVIGEPIAPMIRLMKRYINEGCEVRIVTARAYREDDNSPAMQAIREWCLKHVGMELKVTNEKDYAMLKLYDDRAISVIPNRGVIEVDHWKHKHAEKAQQSHQQSVALHAVQLKVKKMMQGKHDADACAVLLELVKDHA